MAIQICVWWVLKLLPVLLGSAAASIVKVNETTSKSNTELTKPLVDHVKSEEFSVLMSERRVYLEDVFYSIKSMDWQEDEQLCLNQTLDLLTSLQNFTLWAVAMWDATASDPRGVLYGNRYQLGNYDECLNPVWATDQHPHLTPQYCLVDVELLMKPRNLPKYKIDFKPFQSALDKIYYTGDESRRPLNLLTWGACVPAACSPRSVGRLLTALLHRSNLAAAGLRFNVTVDRECQMDVSDKTYPPDTIAFFTVFGVLVVTTIVCTILHCYYKNIDDDCNKGSAAVRAFSLMKNVRSLSVRNDGGLDVLYGIRFLSICLIVVSHRFGMFSGGPVSNGFENDRAYQNAMYALFIVHDDLLVDTFFFMSGLLAAKSLLSKNKLPNCFILVLQRYMRLAPALAIAIWYSASAYEYSGSGPLWARSVDYEGPSCRRNWWLNLLMISNYLRVDDMCIVTSWYIPCDFHFFLVAVWLCYLARRSRGHLLAAMTPLAALSVIIPAVITAYNKLPAVLLFYNAFVVNPRGDETYQRVYIPSHTRAAPYLVGVVVGYFVTKVYPIATTDKMSRMKSTMIAVVGVLVMLAVMVSGTVFYESERQYNAIEAAFYAGVNRPVWAFGVAALVLACAYGTVPLVTSVLSWSPWVPLSKLAYGLYLAHVFIIIRDVQSARDPSFYDPAILVHRAVADIAWGTFFALLLWLLVEAPCINLLLVVLAHSPQDAPALKEDGVKKEDDCENMVTASTNRFTIPPAANVPQVSDILRSKC